MEGGAGERFWTAGDLASMAGPFRAMLMNSVTGFKPANVVGTTSAAGVPNLAIFSSVVHLGSDPPLVGLVFRPPVARDRGSHSWHNLRETEQFTLSHVGVGWYERAHATSARWPDGVSEFEAVGLTPWWPPGMPDFRAPAVAEAAIRMGLRWEDSWEVPANGCRFVVGRVEWLVVPEAQIAADGAMDLVGAGTAAVSGLDGYHRVERLARCSYARPHQPVEVVKDFLRGFPRD